MQENESILKITPSLVPELPETASWTDDTYQYIWFGSYPQTEMTGDLLTNEIINAKYDEEGNAYIGETRYKRLCENDVTFSFYSYYSGQEQTESDNHGYYDWTNKVYAYFRYEPIKWRVLNKNESCMLLLSEMTLDTKQYNETRADCSWEECSLRLWLNGLDNSINIIQEDLINSRSSFLATAFSEKEIINIVIPCDEQNQILESDNKNDLVFLLSQEEACDENNGFNESSYEQGSKSGRVSNNTDYAIAMGSCRYLVNGVYANESCWWLRTRSGIDEDGAIAYYVLPNGQVGTEVIDNSRCSVRPAIYFSIEMSNERNGIK